jgi:type IV pilus assembly protein PilA
VLSQFYKSPKGFTLIEILIGIAIIGILSAVAIPQYNKYKIRGYDAHSKQALRDMHTLCNAYWLDNDSSDECELSLIKSITYGFNQNPEIVATLPPSPLDNFCGAAKHNSSPNTYSIDSAAMISDNEDCGVALAKEKIIQAKINNKVKQLCEDATKVNNSNTELGCRLTHGYRATGTYEEELKRKRRGQLYDYNKSSALGSCKCDNGFRHPKLMNPIEFNYNPGLRVVARPCDENIPTLQECVVSESIQVNECLKENPSAELGACLNPAFNSPQDDDGADKKEECLSRHYQTGRYNCMGQNLNYSRDEECLKMELDCIHKTYPSPGATVVNDFKNCIRRNYGKELVKCSGFGYNFDD